jgi:RNA polymerase sigma factor (sigma-70 family)
MILPNYHSKEEPSFACAQAGCENCMRRLLKQNEFLVYLVVSHQCPGNLDYADLSQVGRIGLWRAILHFRPELGYPFWHYAGTVIRHRIWRAVKEDQKAQGWQEPERAGDSLPVVVEAWQREQVRQAIAEEFVCLPERLREIVCLYYGFWGQEPLTLDAIGQQMGLTRERIRQLRNEALVLLRLPALSIRLRGLCERDTQREYRQSRQENDAWLRNRRGMK